MTAEELQNVWAGLQTVPAEAAATATAQLGEQQAAQGALAAQMGASGGNGIGSYTMNRLVQPTVDSETAALVVQGKQAVLSQRLKEMQQAAQDNYDNAKAQYYRRQKAGSGGSGSSGGDQVQQTPATVNTNSSGLSAEDVYKLQLQAKQMAAQNKPKDGTSAWVGPNGEITFSVNEHGNGNGWYELLKPGEF